MSRTKFISLFLGIAMLISSFYNFALADEGYEVKVEYTKTGEEYSASGTYNYPSGMTDDIWAILAVYDSVGALKSVRLNEIAPNSENDGSISDVTAQEGDTVKGMLWRKRDMYPLADIDECTVSGNDETSSPQPDNTDTPTATPTVTADTNHWDFAKYTDDTTVTATAAQTVDYDGLEIHLASGDKITDEGLYWSEPSGTKSDAKTTVTNNRYIIYKPTSDGILSVTYKGSANASNKHPRITVSCGESLACTTKDANNSQFEANQSYDNNSTDFKIAEFKLSKDKTYYIWSYYYNSSSNQFTISDIAFEEAQATVRTRNIYGSNMLLQRDEPVVIDGKGEVISEVSVTLTNATSNETVQTVTANTTSESGAWNDKEWTVTLDPVTDYSSTYKLTISADGAEDVVYDNILFGDQYIFSGQSNMWMSVEKYKNIDKDAYGETAVNQHLTDKIRLMYTPGESDYGTATLQYDAQNNKPWRDFSTYANVKDVGAPAYTAAVKLYEETGVPIGVIDNPYPGSYISSWFDSALELDNCNLGKNSNSNERNWYCGRIYPLRNLKLSGIFWYQGEADAATKYHDNPYEYYLEMLPRLISSWRELFKDADLPFYYTQLSRIGSTIVDENNPDTGASGKMPIKLAQTDTYLNMADKTNVGIVSTLDLYGNHNASGSRNCRTDIHLGQKQFVGDRMANLALVDIYNKTEDKNGKAIYRMGPLYKSSEIKNGKIVVTFDCNGQLSIMPSSQYTDTTGEQKITDGEFNPNALNEFELAGEDGVWYAATAEVTASNQVTVSSTDVAAPVKVRYCGKDYPESPNLTDESGLPSYVFEKTADNAGDEPTETEQPSETEQPQETEQPSETEEPKETAEPVPMPEVLATYKFDFIAEGETEDNGSYPVTKDSEYNTTFTTDGLQYGLYGGNENDYKLANYVDGVTTVKGQVAAYIEGEDCIGAYEVTGEETSGQTGYGQIAGLYPIRFSMAGENGGYYRVKVTLKGLDKTKNAEATLFSERRHPIITNETIPAGESKTVEFTATLQNVAIKNRATGTTDTYKDNKVNVVAVGENVAIDKIEIYKVAHQPTIFMYDDSTGCDYAMLQPYFEFQNYGGTGQFFSKYLNEGIAVANQGDGGINAADNAHWNAAKSSISEGDYVYVQYGHNHKNDGPKGYVQSLNKYYDYAHDAGAYTILAGPIDRHNSSQYSAGTNTWSSTLSGYSTAAEYFTKLMILRGPDTVAEFVTKVKASSSKNIDASVYEWADEEIAKGLDEENGRDDIAFVDLNAPTLSWLSEVCETVKTQREQSSYSASYSNYYFRSVNGSSVDGTHPNDAGADNTAYFFFEGASKIVNAENKDAVKTVEAAVLEPLVKNMRDASPLQASEELVKLGGAPNSAWPTVFKSSNAAEYPTAVKAIEWNDDGTIDSVSIIKQESKKNMDAYGILELKIFDENDALKGTIYSTQVDNTWDDGSLVRFSLDEEEATNRLTGDTTAVYDETAGDYFTAVIWQATDNGDGLQIYIDGTTNEPVQYSQYYKEDDGSGALITNEDGNAGEDFNFYGAIYSEGNASNLHGNNGWLVNGSNSKNTLLGKDGERYFTNIESTGNSGSFLVYKKLTAETPVSGSISFSMDLQYNSGSSINIGVGNGIKSGSPWVSNRLNLLTIDANSDDSTGNTANVKVTDGSTAKTVGTISKDTWTTVTGTLDMDNGTLTVKVGDGEQMTASVANYDTINTVLKPSSLTAFFIRIADRTAAGIKMSNLSVTRNAVAALPDKTLTIASENTQMGTVSINGSEELTVTDTMNTVVTISAEPKTDAHKFLGWYDGETLVSEDRTVSLRLHKDMTLTAKFKYLATVTVSAASNNTDYGTVTINKDESGSLTVQEEDSVTFRVISKSGYKFVSWTSDGTVVSKSPSYTISAKENIALTATFAPLDEGETVWEFSDIEEAQKAVTDTETAQASYGSFEIHLGTGGDSVNEDGVKWLKAGGTKSDGTTTVSNNRYIKYTAQKNGTLNINFKSPYQVGNGDNNNPRLYIVPGTDLSATTKNNSGSAGAAATVVAADTDTTLTIKVTKDTDYYIWGYCYGHEDTPFIISSINFVEPKTYTVFASASTGGRVIIDGEAIAEKEVVENTEVTLTAVPENGMKLKGWKIGSASVSASYEYTFAVNSNISLTAEFEAIAATEQHLNFAEYRGANAITATAQQTITYEGITDMPVEIHLASGDKVSGAGIYWAAPSMTAGGNDSKVTNGRYIKITAPSDGTLSFMFSANKTGTGNNKPRIYYSVGTDESCMVKSTSTATGATGANTLTAFTLNMEANKTYYIWSQIYNTAGAFTIPSISFTPAE